MVAVRRAWRDGAGELTYGSTIGTIQYDGNGRRNYKEVAGCADWDFHYYFYYDGHSPVEVRNGDGDTIKQQVWGTQYVDELVQLAVNDDPTDEYENTCESTYWALQDANYNVLGLVESDGALKERYEYAAYGGRQVFGSAGSNDTLCGSLLTNSQHPVAGYPHSLNEFGHQGLFFDKEWGLSYVRTRYLHHVLARWMQNDPTGYPDGPNRFEAVKSNPVMGLDPEGQLTVYIWNYKGSAVAWGHSSLMLEDGTYISFWPDSEHEPKKPRGRKPFIKGAKKAVKTKSPWRTGKAVGVGKAKEKVKAGVKWTAKPVFPRTFEDDVDDEGRHPDHAIDIDFLDEPLIKIWWEAYKKNVEWVSTSTNCSYTV